ncbi:MAG: SufD family Fe-S cluster assembly protein [Thomasclavelia sp.]
MANVNIRLATLSKDKENKHITISIVHEAPHTTWTSWIIMVLTKDEANLVIDGIGRITKGQSSVQHSHQANKIIVFDTNYVKQSANPYLYIDEYDVKACHRAGVRKDG